MGSTTIDLSFDCDTRAENSLYELWKVTKLPAVSSKFSSTERLNNRMWRILSNEALLRHKLKSALIQDLTQSQIELQRRQSMAPSASRSTLFSHSCHVGACAAGPQESGGLVSDSDSDMSDISEEDDFSSCDDEEDDAGTGYTEAVPSVGAPPASTGTGEQRSTLQVSNGEAAPKQEPSKPSTKGSNMFYLATTPSPPSNGASHESSEGSHPKNGLQNKTNTTTNGTNSGGHFPKSNDSSIHQQASLAGGRVQRSDSLFSSNHLINSSTKTAAKDDGSSSTEISEVESELEESDDEKHNDRAKETKKPRETKTGKNMESCNDDESEWLSVSSEDDRSCVSTVPTELIFSKRQNFGNRAESSSNLNSTATINHGGSLGKTRSLLSGLFLNEMANPAQPSPRRKPLLQRASTTGIITLDQSETNNRKSSTEDTKEVSRPSILFSKKYASTADISKNYPHYKNFLVQNDILRDESGNQTDSESESIVKQKSSVGISDFMVTTKLMSSGSQNNLEKKDRPMMKRYMSYNDNSSLSSSLNKYSISSHSIKNILSKSSISISNLFNQKNMLRRGASSSDKISASRTFEPNQSFTASRSVEERDSPVTNSLSPHSVSPPIATKTNTRTQPRDLDEKANPLNDARDSSALSSKTAKLSPKTTRRSMLSTELSKSLKDSIIIDYKLGKVPLPERVIKNEDLVHGQSIDGLSDSGTNDYHSKGW
ncbi:Piso0_001488 [Millerozyma farinosa CBS 7064]|uniref:Piso0_001488 protein n=1 Tax=Pichia sorbitophila (strain ATCC MYA-4447 / BCRC 22081 / CBS 7064 / NBRC 10061 / NRRL Y-12695) TaxID=559304 RepID=G8YKX6_PICSO|nr:Piso0_001488 [Millerozyma farinosa CBS 7064]